VIVLSLFDGISCGQLALRQAQIPYEKYYASEIDANAIKVTQFINPETVQLGDVVSVKGSQLPDIDLLIGGSPCQGFSIAGKRLNFEDPRSQLFFEFVRLLYECEPRYFLLENVVMKKQFLDIISEHLGVNPVLINSKDFSAQDRKRYYWTNIPIGVWEPSEIALQDVLQPSVPEKFWVAPRRPVVYFDKGQRQIGYIGKNNRSGRIYHTQGKSITLCGEAGGLCAKTGCYLVNNKIRKLTPVECERLQTVPDNYTDVGLSDNQRYRLLGNGWTVKVIAHIFQGMNLR
jgi:site-specific DNA-cytosine methylase